MSTIINLRGTYGSGKTFLARLIMDAYNNQVTHMLEGRKRPLYYTFEHPNGGAPLAVIGSYETVCGGCDTINDSQQIFDCVDFLSKEGYDVLYESLLLTADVGRTRRYFVEEKWPLSIIWLNLPANECEAAVNLRRAARGQMEPVNPKNLLGKITSCKSSCKTLEGWGVPVYRLGRFEAYLKALELLNIEHCL